MIIDRQNPNRKRLLEQNIGNTLVWGIVNGIGKNLLKRTLMTQGIVSRTKK